MPRGDKAQIMQYEIVLPDENDLVRFSERVGPLCGKITANDMQSRTLAQLRDALLPKLMSGELDAEAVKVEG